MNRLSRQKKQALALIVALTIGGLAGVWFGLVNAQRNSLRALGDKTAAAQRKLQLVLRTIETSDRIQAGLEDSGKRLENIESGMAAGDLYSWAIETIRQFKASYKIDIPQFSQIDGPRQVNLLPGFPYKQIAITIAGAGGFYDIGQFIADFENKYPHMRIQNLSLVPGGLGEADPAANPAAHEKLSFRMEIVALVKPTVAL